MSEERAAGMESTNSFGRRQKREYLCALDRKGLLEKPLAKDNKVPIY